MSAEKMKMTKMSVVVVVAVCFLALFSGALRGADASFAPDVVSADVALPNTCDRVPGGYTNKNCTWFPLRSSVTTIESPPPRALI